MRRFFLSATGLLALVIFIGCSSDSGTAIGPSPSPSTWNWHWQNPLPQGNDLEDVAFVDAQHGYAVGVHGTVLYTTDGGSSWLMGDGGVSERLSAVSFADANHGWAVGENGVVLHTSDGSATAWTRQTVGSNSDFYGVVCTDANTAWIAGDDGIFHTTDGGSLWNLQRDGSEGALGGLSFISPTHGWAVGYGTTGGSLCGIILETTDSGATWIEHPYGPCDYLRSVCFVDSVHGWTTGNTGRVFPTTDGGVTWTEQRVGDYSGYDRVVFKDVNIGWLVESGYPYPDDNPYIYFSTDRAWRTMDGGATWTELSSGGRGISFLDANTGWMVGWGGAIYGTTDGGATLQAFQRGTTALPLRDAAFVTLASGVGSVASGWVVGDSMSVLHTGDGSTWTRQYPPVGASGLPGTLNALTVINENTVVAVGGSNYSNGAVILRTQDAGATWTTEEFGGIGGLTGVAFPDYGNGWAVGYSGTLLHSTDGGGSWVLTQTGTSAQFVAITFLDRLNAWVVGANQSYVGNQGSVVLHTTNGGVSWQATPISGVFYPADIIFTSVTHGFIVGDNGLLLRTTDGGMSWALQGSHLTASLTRIVFPTPSFGWICGFNGTLLSSTDGGVSWNSVATGTANTLLGIAFADPEHGWIVGTKGTILHEYDSRVVSLER